MPHKKYIWSLTRKRGRRDLHFQWESMFILWKWSEVKWSEVKWSEVKWKSLVVSGSLWPRGLYSPWNSPGQNTGVGSHSLLQGIFSTQGSNTGLLGCSRTLYQLSHKGSPRILEWVTYPFSSGSSWSINWTQVSCIAGGFFTKWAIREDLYSFWPCI